MTSAIFLLVFAAIGVAQGPSESGISIINNPNAFIEKNTRFENPDPAELGRQIGSILNAHYFPALRAYEVGSYQAAFNDITYLVMRPEYLNGNPNQANYLSTGHYIRGMIFLYHAEGGGRLLVAKSEFEKAIQWNSQNYVAYLELARLYVIAGLNEQAITVLKQLIDIAPTEDIAGEARKELKKLAPGDSK